MHDHQSQRQESQSRADCRITEHLLHGEGEHKQQRDEGSSTQLAHQVPDGQGAQAKNARPHKGGQSAHHLATIT